MDERLLASAAQILAGLVTDGKFIGGRVVSFDPTGHNEPVQNATIAVAGKQAIAASIALARALRQEIERQDAE